MIHSAPQRRHVQIVVLVLLVLLIGCSASSQQPAGQPLPQNLAPPPSAADLDLVSDEIGIWVQMNLPDGSGTPTPGDMQGVSSYTLGRPSRIALLDRDTIFQFASGQSMQAQLQPTGGWFIPVYQDQQLVATAELDAAYSIVSVGSLTARQPPVSIVGGYDDPEAEVWYVPFQSYPAMILLLRSSGERMAVLENDPNPLHPSLVALGGQEVAPDQMMEALERAVTERCRVLWVYWQC